MEPAVLVALISGLGGLIAACFVLIKGLGENRNQAFANKAALDKRIDERMEGELRRAYAQIDDLGKKLESAERRAAEREERQEQWEVAMTGVLASLALQWPPGDPPKLDPRYIAILADTVPIPWRISA